MAQLQALRIASTDGNGTQTVAIVLHRDAVVGIGEQQHPRGVGHDLDHLAHQATGIEHRLAEEHAILLALVDQDAVGEGVGVDADQLSDQHLFFHQRGGIEQLAQAHVLLGEGGQLLQAALHQQRFGLELLVLRHQLAAAGDLLGRLLPQRHRQTGHAVGRLDDQAELRAQRLQHLEARIHHHQHGRQHDQHQQSYAQRRSLGE